MKTQQGARNTRLAVARGAYQDGLLEIAAGIVLFIVALATGRPAFYWTYLAAIVVLGPGLERLKARYTYPRIGYVRLPDESPTRLRRGIATWFVGVFLLIGVVLTLTGHLTDHLAWRRAAPALAGLLFAGGFVYLARRSQTGRHYALAIASAISGLLMTWPVIDEPYGNLRVWAILMALPSLLIGAVVLARFVRNHPVMEERHRMSAEEQVTHVNDLLSIDRIVHEPARLVVLCHLSIVESADFLFLLRSTGLTRGNLSAHMRKLESAGFVDVEKTFVDRLPLTVYRLTKNGRQALVHYRDQMISGLSIVE